MCRRFSDHQYLITQRTQRNLQLGKKFLQYLTANTWRSLCVAQLELDQPIWSVPNFCVSLQIQLFQTVKSSGSQKPSPQEVRSGKLQMPRNFVFTDQAQFDREQSNPKGSSTNQVILAECSEAEGSHSSDNRRAPPCLSGPAQSAVASPELLLSRALSKS